MIVAAFVCLAVMPSSTFPAGTFGGLVVPNMSQVKSGDQPGTVPLFACEKRDCTRLEGAGEDGKPGPDLHGGDLLLHGRAVGTPVRHGTGLTFKCDPRCGAGALACDEQFYFTAVDGCAT
jgi:hypothetical protein